MAMGNGNDLVKQAADYVTGTNDGDGIAEAIEKFVLGE
ncbi:HAD hydrolase family protein [Lactobacillus nasalidis]